MVPFLFQLRGMLPGDHGDVDVVHLRSKGVRLGKEEPARGRAGGRVAGHLKSEFFGPKIRFVALCCSRSTARAVLVSTAGQPRTKGRRRRGQGTPPQSTQTPYTYPTSAPFE